MSSTDAVNCGSGGGDGSSLGLRVASVFIILVGSMFGALFPVLAKRSTWLHVPKPVFDFAKYFGSGVIIATAFIHLLASGVSELSSPCLSPDWALYPYSLAFCLLSIFGIFIVELLAFQWGTAKLAKIGLSYDAHGHGIGAHSSHGPEGVQTELQVTAEKDPSSSDIESNGNQRPFSSDPKNEDKESFNFDDNVLAQMVGVGILEFGVLLHSVLIGLTLAVTSEFVTLFVVIIFHQTFEGLGVGSRLAYLELPRKYYWIPVVGALLYGITTPIGIAIGLGVRTTYNPNSTTASIVSGILDSLSAGVLVYTGLVELLAHEFLFNKEMMTSSPGKICYAIFTMCLGCGIMALLGRWA
jgi:zinc transporter 1/2/3